MGTLVYTISCAVTEQVRYIWADVAFNTYDGYIYFYSTDADGYPATVGHQIACDWIAVENANGYPTTFDGGTLYIDAGYDSSITEYVWSSWPISNIAGTSMSPSGSVSNPSYNYVQSF